MLSDGRPCGNQESHSPITIHFFRSAAPLGAVNSGSDPLQWETVGLRVRRDQPDFGYWSRVRRGRLVNTGALAVGGTGRPERMANAELANGESSRHASDILNSLFDIRHSFERCRA